MHPTLLIIQITILRAREGPGRCGGASCRGAGDDGSEEAARQVVTTRGQRRTRDGNAVPLGAAVKPAVDEVKHAAAVKAVSEMVMQNWSGALEKIDPDAMVAIFDQAVAAEENQPGSGQAVLMRAVDVRGAST